jgi:hypothetical protein
MPANELVQIGRAKNALLTFFEQRLSIPKIYLDADWDGNKIDVLAINRDGVGDVHAALLFTRKYLPDGTLDIVHDGIEAGSRMVSFASFPAHFRYIAAVDVYADLQSRPFVLADKHIEESFSQDGIGRIGFLRVAVPSNGDPTVEIVVKPERFRASIATKANEYIAQHEADWEIRA